MNERYTMMPAVPLAAPAGPQALGQRPARLTVLTVLQLEVEALLTRLAASAEGTILEARRQMAATALLAEEAEAELHLRRNLRALPTEQGRQILNQEMEVERLLLEREQLRQQRLHAAFPLEDPLPALPAAGAVDWHITARQIEALAIRAVSRFNALPPAEAERAWALWQRELGLRLPPYAAMEVARRAAELNGLAR